MNISIEQLASIARDIEVIPERRPQNLLNMPSATIGLYYKFLYEIVSRCKPELAVELGTDTGTSAIHMSFACPETHVITVDHLEAPIKKVSSWGFKNLEAVHSTSISFARRLMAKSMYMSIDLLFVDTDHNLKPVLQEYLYYYPLMKHGGIVFFDDIELHEGMLAFWDSVEGEKVLLPNLHHTGFGAVKIDTKMLPHKSQVLLEKMVPNRDNNTHWI